MGQVKGSLLFKVSHAVVGCGRVSGFLEKIVTRSNVTRGWMGVEFPEKKSLGLLRNN